MEIEKHVDLGPILVLRAPTSLSRIKNKAKFEVKVLTLTTSYENFL
jgi:hypothetical protein